MKNFNYHKAHYSPYIRNQRTANSLMGTVYISISCDGLTFPMNTYIQGFSMDWNKKSKSFDGVENTAKNHKIRQVIRELEDIEYDLSHSNQEVTAKIIAKTFKEKLDGLRVKKENKPNFLQTLEMYIQKEINLGIKKQTIKNLRTNKRNLVDFLNSINKNQIKCQDFDAEMAMEFQVFIHQKELSDNHASRILGLAKRALDYAITKKFIQFNPINSFKLKVKDNLNTTSLERSDIQTLINLDLTERLQKVRDIYLFMCGTGIDHCDYMRLKNENFRHEGNFPCIQYSRLKSSCVANPVLIDFAVKILEKYGSISKLPKCSLTELNREIKEVAKLANIKIKLTSKVARKTFANYYANGVGISDESLAYMMGHTSTNKLKHYRKTNQNRVLEELRKAGNSQLIQTI